METLLIYLLKASGILVLFYLAYQVFLKRETFFWVNRHFLMAGILTALFLPSVSIPNYIEVATIPLNYASADTTLIETLASTLGFNWVAALFGIYLIGMIVLIIKFITQMISLVRLIRMNKVAKHGKFYHVETTRNIAPFSFFNHIFYNPTLYSKGELSAILKHEKAHSSQWHSVDVILSHLIAILTWMNPFSWLYQSNIKQNLEFLADESVTKEVTSIKNYQYTLLKVSGNHFYTPIVNNFYNSLTRLNVLGRTFWFNAQYGQVKKRIVMLNKSKSNKRNILKIALIVPVLAVFLVSFNTVDVYIPVKDEVSEALKTALSSQIIEITIDKNTTEKELKDIKNDLAQKGVDFSYTVVHNTKKEIISISVDFAVTKDDGEKLRSSSSFNNGDKGIDPIHIVYDEETNSISMGSKKHMHKDISKKINIHTDEDSDKTVWVNAYGDGEEQKTIEIIEKDGKETIIVNGKEVTRKEFDAMKDKDGIHEKHIKIMKSDNGDKEKNVFIMKMSDDDEDVDMNVVTVEKGKDMFFISGDGDEKPIFIIDGKESKEEEMEKLDSSEIETINVIKGEKAEEKYGKKGKNGVVEITTKKE